MTTENNNAKLFAKIAQVMSKVRTLEKTGENKFDKYSYVTADAIATRVGSLMAEVGLAFLPSLVSVDTSEYTTKSGGSNFRTVAHFQMTLACTETGATFTSLWSGEAIDRSDKSISKAAVSAVKYFLLKTFLLAGGDEEDADAGSPTVDAPKATQKPQRAPEATAQGDVLFTPDNATRNGPVASATQLKRLHALGREFYGNEWDEQRAKLVLAVSTGSVTSANDLTPTEADKLIRGIERKMAEVAQKQAA